MYRQFSLARLGLIAVAALGVLALPMTEAEAAKRKGKTGMMRLGGPGSETVVNRGGRARFSDFGPSQNSISLTSARNQSRFWEAGYRGQF